MHRHAAATPVPACVNDAKTLRKGTCTESIIRATTQTKEAPHNAIKLEELSLFAGPKQLLRETKMTIGEHTRASQFEVAGRTSKTIMAGTIYGLVGPNGSGKSTLLSALADSTLPLPAAWDVILVGQGLPQPSQRTAVEEVLSVDDLLAELMDRRSCLEAQLTALAEGSESSFAEVQQQLIVVQDQISTWGDAEERVVEVLLKLGFKPQDSFGQSGPHVEAIVSNLSGGWRMKVELAKALWLQPKLLLLDEPSNHLDLEALRWLRHELGQYPNTVMLVSHDVELLHDVSHEILWIHNQEIVSVPRHTLSPSDLAHMQGRPPFNFHFAVPGTDTPGNHGISFHDVEFSYPESRVSDGTPFLTVKKGLRLSGNSRCVLVGQNGSGKSTFLQLCAGQLEPTSGSVDSTPHCKVGYFSQHFTQLEKHADLTAAAYLALECHDALAEKAGVRFPGGRARAKQAVAYERQLAGAARAVLGNFGLSGDMAISIPLRNLSGGQKACLKLAALSLQPVHILFLDEPTNHLDAEASEALAKGLAEYKGGILAVTHDDLLIYRLIQCNWAESELLVCQNGCIQRQAALGASCMKALKEQIRQCEDGIHVDKAAGQNDNQRKQQARERSRSHAGRKKDRKRAEQEPAGGTKHGG
eukprot:TRINITY_DN75854_c0_g1_i1.p1 TRINITY_DN75854_c0_g1~~TRINITY_DN75854_c0_g1_i1.p1  ORF type:complete len:642 (+),score=119.76 TRINITY_DN75854_c0_g1_i1:318-2243(+)